MRYINPPLLPASGFVATARPYLDATFLTILCSVAAYFLGIWSGTIYLFYLPALFYIIWRYELAPGVFAILLAALSTYLLPLFTHGLITPTTFRTALFVVPLACAAVALAYSRRREQSLILMQRHLLDVAREPIMIRNSDNRLVYWNQGAERLYGFTSSEAKGQVPHELMKTPFADGKLGGIYAQLKRDGYWSGKLLRTCKDGRQLTVESHWTRSEEGYVLQTETDITEHIHMQEELQQAHLGVQQTLAEVQKLNRVLNVLSRCNQAMVHAKDETELLQQVVDIIVEHGGYAMSFVSLLGEDPLGYIKVGALSGNVGANLEDLKVTRGEGPYGMGPTGVALRTGKVTVEQDIASAETLFPWKIHAWYRRLGALISLPLTVESNTVAALTVFSHQANVFTQEEIDLLGELAGDLAFGLSAIRTRQLAEKERSARVTMESQFRQVQKMDAIGQLAGGIAHDFNNLLMVIIAQTEMLLGEKLEDAPQRRAQGIMQAAKSAANLTRQLLAFSRRQVLKPTVQSLNQIVLDYRSMLERLVGERIAVNTVLAINSWEICVDRSQMEQVLMNLVVNARDAMPDGGKLTIETANTVIDAKIAEAHPLVPTGDYVMLAVSDTGIGVDAETRARIFDPFFTTKREGKGTGLGLATVYGIVKQSGGYIWVYSELGKGSCFKIFLPRHGTVAVAEAEGSSAAVEVPKNDGNTCVLVVDDDNLLRQLLCEFLTSAGYHVLQASCVEDAIAQVMTHEQKVGLVLTDWTLKGGNGQSLVQTLRTRGMEFAALYISGYSAESLAQQGVLDPGAEFLQKPFSQNDLLNKVAEVLHKYEQKKPK